MKRYLIILCQLILLSACHQKGKPEIVSLESEMINFFQEMLEENYGRRDAVDMLVKGMEKYHFNYLLEVDKQRLKEINEKLYSAWLFSYFLDEADLKDSCRLYVPAGISPADYRQSAEFQQAVKGLGFYNSSSVHLVVDSAKYVYSKSQVENMILPLKKKTDGFTYWQKELEQASHPAMKIIRELEDATGGVASSSVLWGVIATNADNICSDFKTDRDIQMFLTLYFWKYLCHFANIDFYTGRDKTAEVLGFYR